MSQTTLTQERPSHHDTQEQVQSGSQADSEVSQRLQALSGENEALFDSVIRIEYPRGLEMMTKWRKSRESDNRLQSLSLSRRTLSVVKSIKNHLAYRVSKDTSTSAAEGKALASALLSELIAQEEAVGESDRLLDSEKVLREIKELLEDILEDHQRQEPPGEDEGGRFTEWLRASDGAEHGSVVGQSGDAMRSGDEGKARSLGRAEGCGRVGV